MTEGKNKIFFILPAYNEEKGIGFQLKSIQALMAKIDYNYEVIVINDGSIDRTVHEVKEFQKTMPVVLLNHETNLGVGTSFKTGFTEVMKKIREDDIVISMDADNTQNLNTVRLMISKIQEGYEVVLGSVFSTGGMFIGVPFIRLVISYACNFIYRILFHVKGIKEYTGFYRGYSGKALAMAFDKFGDNLMESKGFAVMAEMLIKFRQIPLFITEVPMIVRYDLKGGISKLRIMPTVMEHLKIMGKNLFKRRII
jgi:dolichol-phosphate mannosyltransferase